MPVLAMASLLTLGGGFLALAQTAAEPETPKKDADGDGRRLVQRLPANLGRGIVGVFHRDSILPLAVGAVATGGASVLDRELRASINPHPGEGWGRAVGTASGAVWSGVLVASVFATGRISKDARFRATSYDLAEAALMNVVYFQSLKLIARRQRPNGANNQSFPSGHTSNAFALATITQTHYGWKAGAPAYLLAGVVGASRLKQDMHYLSDVVAGATLGYIVGRTVARVNSQPPAGGSRPAPAFNVSPMVAGQTRGLQVSVSF